MSEQSNDKTCAGGERPAAHCAARHSAQDGTVRIPTSEMSVVTRRAFEEAGYLEVERTGEIMRVIGVGPDWVDVRSVPAPVVHHLRGWRSWRRRLRLWTGSEPLWVKIALAFMALVVVFEIAVIVLAVLGV